MTATTMRHRVKLSDGRSGVQDSYLDDDGRTVLVGLTVDRQPDGRPCEPCHFAPQSSLRDGVFGFSHLGNVTWEITGPAD